MHCITLSFLPVFLLLIIAHCSVLRPRTANVTTELGTSNVAGIQCLDALTRFHRPHSEDCASALLGMPSDSEARHFQQTSNLPRHSVSGDCTATVGLPEYSEGYQTSWLYIQTVAIQVMVGCLRVYDHNHIRTGGAITIGSRRTALKVSLTLTPRAYSKDEKNDTVPDIGLASS